MGSQMYTKQQIQQAFKQWHAESIANPEDFDQAYIHANETSEDYGKEMAEGLINYINKQPV
jgi:hypothetical protein